jgi:DNA-binding GntR family transcriptional regulator
MSTVESSALVKESLAARMREAIVEGRLRPGQRVIESEWARQFGVAQASVREAINLLILDGFLVKSAGRSARVPRYTQQDIAQIYEVRGALEGLAAQLAAARRADLTPIELALNRMETALAKSEVDVKDLLENDLAFHLALAEASGNPLLSDMLGRLLRPLFTFVLLRMIETRVNTESWMRDLPRHREMIYLMRESEPVLAGRFVQHCISRFMTSAQAVWLPDAIPKRRKKSR